eukprot:TRINITY_DN26381_c0_g1_i2.p1 TRINITY_DN26381_c0_g1~~TRINITY_DN26381_c0_g1_i2.p1  ORF type:complete len:432 (-),score=142.41 TRINITY_DN26381_c0_g1_i2:62-1333(-)
MSEGENELVEQFKAKLKENDVKVNWDIHDDVTLRRFLRAREMVLQDAYDMFVKSLQWREENKVDTILDDIRARNRNFDLINNYMMVFTHGKDKRGMPVEFEQIGKMDTNELIRVLPLQDILTFHIWQQEVAIKELRAAATAAGTPLVQTASTIEDFSNFSYSQIHSGSIGVFKEISAIDEQNYPETLHKYFVINAPSLFPAIFKLISGFLPERTIQKIHVLGSNYKESLLKEIDSDQIPVEYGGTCTSCDNSDGFCYKRKQGPFIDKNQDGTTINPVTTTIGRRSKHEVEVTVSGNNTKVLWQFEIEANTIEYTILFGEDKKKIILEKTVYENKEGVEVEEEKEKKAKEGELEVKQVQQFQGKLYKGEFVAAEKGVYTFVWDNSFSIFKKKTIRYWVTIVNEQKEGEEKKKKTKKKKSKKDKK